MKKVKQSNYAITAKAGSHNDAKPCIALRCVRMLIYEHGTCTTHKCDVLQCKDRIDFYLDTLSNASNQSDFNNYMFHGRQETY